MQKAVRFVFVLGCLVLAPASSHASSCKREVTAQMRFQQGATCWTYAGKATHFVGRFSANQKITIRMRGMIDEYDPQSKSIRSSWTGRQPSVQGPDGFQAEAPGTGDAGRLEIIVPKSGQYRIGFYPCVMWHQQGDVEICASSP